MTKISWTDATWNPIRGCSKVSAGCKNCYAARFAARLSGEGGAYEGLVSGTEWTGKVRVVEDKFDLPYRWRKPRMVFVNSMSDLFHEQVSIATIRRVLQVIADNPRHKFQILTKRTKRLAKLNLEYPENAWIGVSVENQDVVDRIDYLRETSAATKWVSFEPLIGPVEYDLDGIAWSVIGGESGYGCRPTQAEWVRSIIDESRRVGAAIHFKQWGGYPNNHDRVFDGEVYDEYPGGGNTCDLRCATCHRPADVLDWDNNCVDCSRDGDGFIGVRKVGK